MALTSMHQYGLNIKVQIWPCPNADILAWVPKPKIQRDPDSEFNYIHYGKEIKKKIVIQKFFSVKNFEIS
jgi:hypothetical protein